MLFAEKPIHMLVSNLNYENNLNKIIFSSTASVYGDPSNEKVSEEDQLKPLKQEIETLQAIVDGGEKEEQDFKFKKNDVSEMCNTC